MSPPYSFPILSAKEVAVALSNLEIANVSEEMLAAPTPDLAVVIYSSALTYIDLLGDDPRQAAFSGLEQLENPNNHEESIGVINLYCKIKDIISAAGAADFSLKDIFKPESAKMVCYISALLNFIYYRQDKLHLLQPIINENCSQHQEELEMRRAELEDELVKLEALEQQDQPIVLELQAEVDELRQTVQTLNREQAALKARYRNLRDVNDAEIRQKISDAEFSLMECVQENDKLKSRIVQSPEKLQKALEEKRSILAQEQNYERSAFQAYQHLLAKNELYKKASKKLSKYLTEMQAMQEQFNSCKLIEKDVKAIKAKLSDMELMAMSLEAKRVELQGRVDDAEKMTRALEKEKELKCAEADEELKVVKSAAELKLQELDLKQKKIEAIVADVNKISMQTASARNNGEMLLQKLGSKCEELVNEFHSYSSPIDAFLLRLEDGCKQ
ncbi:kinetochore protein NUF2 homolog [Nymphaea colorata]|uniref:kinetochore protein NUF2 homolog n=1 Tax=Nymphaea colorata TaxID=210225 RepID=UPI00129DBB4A|nr:kinetochore protein NUF2 homolog [Nymphaea colorata]